MKKRVLSILLVALMVMGLCTAAFAADQYTDASTATFKVKFTGDGHPAETFTFSGFTFAGVKNAGTDPATGSVVTTGPAVTTIPAVTIDADENEGTATITLPALTEFKAVGAYSYTFTEVAGSTAGVTYWDKEMKLVITVVEDESGRKRIAAVHVEGLDSGDKESAVENTYESTTLKVKKTVAGNMGDTSKYFDVTVTFTGEVTSAITFKGGQYSTDQTVPDTNTVTIQVSHNDEVTFSNIPVGASYTVDEADYSSDGYTTTGEVTTATEIDKNGAAVTITNTKEVTVDTGITMDTIPYIMIALFACLAAALVVIRKRRIAE